MDANREHDHPDAFQTATVLHTGGMNGTNPAKETITEAAVLFDPVTCTSTLTGSMTIPREFTTLTVLQNCRVLAAGGETRNKQGAGSVTATADSTRHDRTRCRGRGRRAAPEEVKGAGL